MNVRIPLDGIELEELKDGDVFIVRGEVRMLVDKRDLYIDEDYRGSDTRLSVNLRTGTLTCDWGYLRVKPLNGIFEYKEQ